MIEIKNKNIIDAKNVEISVDGVNTNIGDATIICEKNNLREQLHDDLDQILFKLGIWRL